MGFRTVDMKIVTKSLVTSFHDCTQLLQCLKNGNVILDYEVTNIDKLNPLEPVMKITVKVNDESVCEELKLWRKEDGIEMDKAVILLLKAATIMGNGESGKGLAGKINKKYRMYFARANKVE